jgi:molybdenum cofactor cytidylyltransferase
MIGAVVLAAGASSRYGTPKQLQTAGRESWVRRTARLAVEAGGSPVVVIIGAHADEVGHELEGLAGARPVLHPGWRQGMGSSIAAGIRTFYTEPAVRGALLLTCDQVELEATIVRRLIDTFDDAPLRMVACGYAGTVGIPVIFGRGWFDRLSKLSGDRGAKALLLERQEWRIDVPWQGGATDRDERRGSER